MAGIATIYNAQNLPTRSATQPKIKAPISAPRESKPPIVEASSDVIGRLRGDSGDFK